MERRKIACFSAALAMGLSTVGIASVAWSRPLQSPDVVVKGERIDPSLQRKVFYHDLNLAFRPGQKELRSRIASTASNLCWDLNGDYAHGECTEYAVRSTDGQVAQAILRARQQMAGLPVGPAVAISMVIGAR